MKRMSLQGPRQGQESTARARPFDFPWYPGLDSSSVVEEFQPQLVGIVITGEEVSGLLEGILSSLPSFAFASNVLAAGVVANDVSGHVVFCRVSGKSSSTALI